MPLDLGCLGPLKKCDASTDLILVLCLVVFHESVGLRLSFVLVTVKRSPNFSYPLFYWYLSKSKCVKQLKVS